ncbi:hypothetical protein BDZ94DRAFT_1315202 [Collybia nuda]|uniref:Uncharacterized protein n=1 Tax=Collybia nuda TaxID=64659 RepID=A0A9P5XTE5_9AGAR|nr:hypothetical protein BDZ94DRAFT_1315202 [Collybia nuda]
MVDISPKYSRITHNRLTTAFFIFTFVHCFAQGVIQSFLFSIDSEYHDLLRGITALADIPTRNFTYLEGSPGHVHLKLCSDIPIKQYNPCDDVFQSTVDVKNPVVDQNHLNAIDRSELALDKVVGGMSIAADRRGGIVFGVNITSGTLNIPLSFQCTQILVHPQQIMRNSMREDATWILLQFWLLVISTMAILYDSVPHILTVLAARSLVTGWAMYAIWRTKYNEGIFEEMIYNSGTPCSINLFPDYFSTRIPDLILNCTALFIACYLSWTLLQVYTAQSFKCVGAPERINRLNKFFMAVLACLQLEAFALPVAAGLWVDVLFNTAISGISTHTKEYKAAFIFTTLVLLPWIAMGWYAIRYEMRRLMIIFLGLAFCLIGVWASMFDSIVYRWTFVQWPLFACYTISSLILTAATIMLGIVCRLNFGKGLAQYLHAEKVLVSSNFAGEMFTHDEEKGPMDINIKEPLRFDQFPIPTLHAAPAPFPTAR